jgi:hypothetical protein
LARNSKGLAFERLNGEHGEAGIDRTRWRDRIRILIARVHIGADIQIAE